MPQYRKKEGPTLSCHSSPSIQNHLPYAVLQGILPTTPATTPIHQLKLFLVVKCGSHPVPSPLVPSILPAMNKRFNWKYRDSVSSLKAHHSNRLEPHTSTLSPPLYIKTGSRDTVTASNLGKGPEIMTHVMRKWSCVPWTLQSGRVQGP